MPGVTLLKYQRTYAGMTKELYEKDQDTYQTALITLRLYELQKRGYYAQKVNRPNRNGTKITFTQAKTEEEYQQELEKILEDGNRLGIKFRKVEEGEKNGNK